MSSLWNRLTQSLVSAGAFNARQPLVAWEASWDEAEALLASGKLGDKVQAADAAQAGRSVLRPIAASTAGSVSTG